MHGRLKSKLDQDEEVKEKLEEAQKAKFFYDNWHLIKNTEVNLQNKNIILDISSKLLKCNPDIYTIWDIRRKLILLLESCDKEEFGEICSDENKLIETCLAINPKSYSCWHQRAWILKLKSQPDLPNELSLCSKFLNFDERNFHCWDHRRYVISILINNSKASLQTDNLNNDIIQKEIDYTLKKIEQNFSNYSAWHYRSVLWEYKLNQTAKNLLIPNLECQIKEMDQMISSIIDLDTPLITNSVFTDPYDQSAWYYLHWLTFRIGNPSFVNELLSKAREEINDLSTVDSRAIFYFSDNFPYPNNLLSRHHADSKFVSEPITRIFKPISAVEPNGKEWTTDDQDVISSETTAVPAKWDGRCQDDIPDSTPALLRDWMCHTLHIDVTSTFNKTEHFKGNKDYEYANLRDKLMITALQVTRTDPAIMIMILNKPVNQVRYIDASLSDAQVLTEFLKVDVLKNCKTVDGTLTSGQNIFKWDKHLNNVFKNTLLFNFHLNHSPDAYSGELLDIQPARTSSRNSHLNFASHPANLETNYFPSTVWIIKNMSSDWTSLLGEEYKFLLNYLVPLKNEILDSDEPDSLSIPGKKFNYEQKQLSITINTDKLGCLYFEPSYHIYDQFSKYFNESFDFERMIKYQDLVEKNMEMCSELASIEPLNKWCRLTWIFLASALRTLNFLALFVGSLANYRNGNKNPTNPTSNAFPLKTKHDDVETSFESGMLDYLGALMASIDVFRKGFYQDMRSKLIIEDNIRKLALEYSTKTLSNGLFDDNDSTLPRSLIINKKELTNVQQSFSIGSFASDFDVFEAEILNRSFFTLKTINLSFNKLISLKWCTSLCCLEKLIVDDNVIESCDGIQNCLLLHHFSIQNNVIKNVQDLMSLSPLTKIKYLVLKGNPICNGAHFPEELYANYPNTLGSLHDYD